MPYQLRHVDETLIVSEQDHFDRCSLENLFEVKIREFERQTRRFELLTILCMTVTVGAAFAELDATVLVLLIVAITGVTIMVLVARRLDIVTLAAQVQASSRRRIRRLRTFAKRRRDKRPPFVNYA